MKDSKLSGKRVKLIRMEDPYTNLINGDMGTIKGEDDAGHILVQWDKGSTLNLIKDIDEYEIMESRKIERFFEYVLTSDNEDVTFTTGYIKVKCRELLDLFKDEYNIEYSLSIMGDEAKFRVAIDEDYFIFVINFEVMGISKELSYGEQGQPEDVHKYEEYYFETVDEGFEILEKEIFKILKISESVDTNQFKFSLVFDAKYKKDVTHYLNKNGIDFEDGDDTYYHVKKKSELIVFSTREKLSKIPVLNLQLSKIK